MKCPCCANSNELAVITKEIPFTHKGETILVQATGKHCTQCGEMILGSDEWQRIDVILKKLYQDSKFCSFGPKFIRDVRKNLHLNQKEAGNFFGCGAQAFSRYENGLDKPPVSVVKLLRVLDRHPELLPEVS